jgi:hypothetical protein
LTDPTAAGENSRLLAMIGIDEIEMMIERDCTDEEVIPEEALMTCPMVMRNPLEADEEGLTVTLKVLAVEEIQRFVAVLNTTSKHDSFYAARIHTLRDISSWQRFYIRSSSIEFMQTRN